METSVDIIKCSVTPNGNNGGQSASVVMDLDKPDRYTPSDELQVYRERGRYTYYRGKDFTDCNGYNLGKPVGTMSVTPISPGKERNKIYVFVRSFTDNKSKEIRVEKDITVCNFKDLIYEKKKVNVCPSQQRLVWNGRNLEDSKTLDSYGIQDGATIDLLGRLRGG